jgi:hypothetical protein
MPVACVLISVALTACCIICRKLPMAFWATCTKFSSRTTKSGRC